MALPSGPAMLLKSFGLDPEKIVGILQSVQAAIEARISGLESGQQRVTAELQDCYEELFAMNAKLDVITKHLGIKDSNNHLLITSGEGKPNGIGNDSIGSC
jgi:hypothetical protein